MRGSHLLSDLCESPPRGGVGLIPDAIINRRSSSSQVFSAMLNPGA